MSKKEFVDAYAKATGETKKRAEELVKERAAREGRNPSTGKPIKIKAKKVVKFKVGKKLADKVADAK